MTTTMSNLLKDMVEEILSRVPSKYTKQMRLTCKNWNALFENKSFRKMHIEKEEAAARKLGLTRMVMMMNHNVYLMGITVNENPSIHCLGKLGSKKVKINQVYHCEGLLLCILKDDDTTKVLVCNPYLRQTRWIQTRKFHHAGEYFYIYAIGYNDNSPKILRFIIRQEQNLTLRYEIYDFDTDLWTIFEVTPNWRIVCHGGFSLKGNTYWCAVEVQNALSVVNHIICFDFTRERFGQLIPLPFKALGLQFASFSSIRGENMAALFQSMESLKVEIWVTTKIDGENASWSNLFTLNNMPYLDKKLICTTFLLDEEKKVAVCFDDERIGTHNVINIIGEAGFLRKLELGEPACVGWPRLCPYVPSIVQIKKRNRVKG
ncbi:hypothetical protein CARUB_v10003888mg [Capsella rubella]|uniref:F-box domain-containing protein n=1 Tax=Capsella rubella TaxID=81985 RepID=R0HDI7_9BRAS|nr:putative F-box protein At4g10740 [Capsella rubella]EOA23100.1 hypothetical protein CARUB_v10003888mg [Capsella rubella]